MQDDIQNKLLPAFIDFLRRKNLLRESFLVAVSGGIDSVTLCELCRQAGMKFSIAHCNFQLRGEESDRDEIFVRNLARRYRVAIFVKKFDTENHGKEHNLSIQEAARALRYDWFVQLKNENQFAYTLLAHHADDNVETLLMNFFRGTGLQGLTAMPEENGNDNYFLRPLLNVRRSELVEFAKRNELEWVEDSSNASNYYTRNFFRNELLPAIKKVFPQVEENLLDNIKRFKKVNALYQLSVGELKKIICEIHGSEVRIPVLRLMKYQHTSLIYEIIKDFGFRHKQVEEVIKLAEAETGKFIENEHCQVIKHRNWLIIAPKAGASTTIAIEQSTNTVSFKGGSLQLKTIPREKFSLNKSETIAQVDAKNVQFPLVLRRWKQGDYFYPLGMRKKKKLARFLIDQKLAKNEKENVWVLESNKKIIWILGMRIDDRFRVTDSTKEILQISFTD